MGGGGDGNWAVLPSPPLAHATLTLVGKIGTGKSATANSILWTDALSSKMSYISVTKTCKMSSATFQGSCGATHTVNVVDTPGLFDMEISIEAARSEIVKCIEMTKDGIHAMLIVFSAASRFPREEHSAVESINLFFGDKILDHIILVFTHGDEVEDEIAWKKMLTVESPVYRILFDCISRMVLVFCLYPSLAYSLYFHPHFSQDMLKLCQNRVVLFDNKNNDIKHREMQRRKLLDAVDFVISSNRGNAFSYQMLPHIQEAIDGQTENSVDGYIAEKISEQISEHLKQITKTVDEKLNNREGEIRRLSESLEKSQREHDNVKQEMKNAENLRKLDEEKRNAHEEEIKNLREEFEKARPVEMLRMKKEIKSLTKSLKLAKDEEECYKCMGEKNECFIL